ncbi:MAG: MerR family transcriptional regulator [Phycisphaerales bacterium]|jgi:DNA-binding transcriptional MerR regulator|nr:MerR family transcriptional regulator [Phycisphaerales bacterium]MBT7171349.1 MerR family transcriptional regulator [Phycisphaerales bacterium]
MTSKSKQPAIPEGYFRLGPAAERLKLSRQTIEYYLLLGLIEPRRVEGRHGRFFDEALLTQIRTIRELNQSGYTLRDIREMFLAKGEEHGVSH